MHTAKASPRRIGAAVVALAIVKLAIGTPAVAAPERIVAAGGVVTEIIYALGEEKRIAGIDSTSQHPTEALKSKPDIGYVRALSAEGVLSLRPDLVLAIEGAGPPDAIRLVSEAKVPVKWIPEDLTREGVLKRIRLVGLEIGKVEAADALAAKVARDFERLEAARQAVVAPKRVLFVLSLQNGRVLAGGRNTSAAAIIAMAGGINAAEAIEGFKPLSDEGLIAAAPDIIVMMKRGNHAASADEIFARPAFATLPAAKEKRLVQMDGLYLLGFGPRTPHAAADLLRAIYPAYPAGLLAGLGQASSAP